MNFKLTQILLMVFFVCLSNQSQAQETITLKGSVIDSTGTMIEMGNVVVLSASDSSLITGTSFWDGNFEMQLKLAGADSVLLRITALGYANYYQKIALTNIAENTINVGELKINSNDLEVVDVVYFVPIVEREIDRLVVNVEGTALSERGTAWDVLKSAPKVIVKSSGEISVVGKGAAIVYLNGQRLVNTDILKSISSKEIDQINIIENPSAKYDAEGMAIIEVITKSAAYEGYQGSVYVMPARQTNSVLTVGGDFKLAKKKFAFSTSYYQELGTFHFEDDYIRRLPGSPAIELLNHIDDDQKYIYNGSVASELRYEIDSLNSVYISYYGSLSDHDLTAENSNDIYEDDVLVGNLSSTTLSDRVSVGNIVSLGYNRTLDTLKSEFSTSLQYLNYDFFKDSDITQTLDYGGTSTEFYQNRNFSKVNVLTAQVDLNKKISENFGFETGVKETYSFNSSGIRFESLIDDAWLLDSALFNEFDYKESITAGYAQIAGKSGRLSYILGLRSEYTTTNGSSVVYGDKVIDRDYWGIFPNAIANIELGNDLELKGNYTYRIERPSYQDLDPFISFIDSLSSFSGNPLLLPSFTHNTGLELVYLEYASVNINYRNSTGALITMIEQKDTSAAFNVITRNADRYQELAFSLVLPYELSWWTTFNAVGYTLNKINFSSGDQAIINNSPSFYISLYNEFRFKNLFNLEAWYEYVSPGSQEIFILRPYQSFGFSISRSFKKPRLNVSLNVFDLFFTEIESGTTEIGGAMIDYRTTYDSRTFQLSLTWKFGKLKSTDNSNVSEDSEEQYRIKNGM